MKSILIQLMLLIVFDSSCLAYYICDESCAQEAYEYACLSRYVYTVDSVDSEATQKGICNGYNLIDYWVAADSDVTWYNASLKLNGIKLGVYRNFSSGKQVVAFAGTQSDHFGIDVITDILQNRFYTAIISPNYLSALVFVQEYKKNNPNVILTGHSLGGGLATWASYNTDNTPAHVFNPALVSYPFSPLASGVKAYISANPNIGIILPARDIVSEIGNEFGNLRFAKEFFVPIDAGLTNSFLPHENVVPLHKIANLENALNDLLPEAEQHPSPPQPIYPTPIKPIIATNSPATSSPGGDAMLQKVQYGTPNGTFLMTICKKNLEGCEETWTYDCGSGCRFDADGSKTITYTPSSDKQVGYYEWWVTDQTTGAESNKGFYFIKDTASLEPWYGYYGSENIDNTPVSECLPDFVAKRAWITKSENGADKYVFESGDKAWINAKVKNEGCANSPQDISVWYLLSKGEKEDDHHDWVKIGSDTIRDYELTVGQAKTEKEEFSVPTEPGKYNIVACADRIASYDNGDGAVREENKSNDCSTEAVFTVLPKNNPPVGYFDSATCDSLDGWAKDPDTSSSVFIRFYKDGPAGTGIYIGSTFADINRNDLPYTDKNHGFSFALPNILNDGVAHQVYAYAIDDAGGTNTLLTNSPKTVQCGLTPDQAAAVMTVIQNILLEDVSQPDLTVISPSASKTSLAPSESFTFSATVKNSGTASSAATTLRWYRSTDATISTADTALGSAAIGALSANQTWTQSTTLTAPATAGTYWLGACADAVSGESSTTNNCSAGVQITVAATAKPDLTVISPSASKTSLAPSESFTFSATVKNSGTASSAATTLRWYRSTDATISTADTALGSAAVGALSANQTSAQSTTLTAPATAGTYWLGACADAVSGESSTTNNCSAGVQITVAATAKPDLTVISPSASKTSLAPSESFTFSATVKNSGTASSAATTLRWYRSTDATISTADTALGSAAVGALSANQTSAQSTTLTAPATAGTYWLGACADAVSGESSTTNNCSAGVQITVAATAKPDLTVSSLLFPYQFDAGDATKSVTAVCYNQGTLASVATTANCYYINKATQAVSGAVCQIQVPALAVNQTVSRTAMLAAPCSEGAYQLKVCVNSGANAESNTGNNCMYGDFSVIGNCQKKAFLPAVELLLK